MAHFAVSQFFDAEEARGTCLEDFTEEVKQRASRWPLLRWPLLVGLALILAVCGLSGSLVGRDERMLVGRNERRLRAINSTDERRLQFWCSEEFKTPQTVNLVGKSPAWGDYLGVEPMPAKPSNWAELRNALNDTFEVGGKTYGYADVDIAPKILYESTKVPGVFERVPYKLRGVYWLKGLPVPEVLATLQYGWWFAEEQTMVSQFLPLDWAWYGAPKGTIPKNINWLAAWLGGYRNGGKDQALAQTSSSYSYSYTFQECPSHRRCKEGSQDLSYAILEGKAGNHLNNRGGLGDTMYTIEELEGVQPGSRWYRGVYNLCGNVHTTGYELAKIIDAEGMPLEPYYSEWKEFMEGYPLILWSGDSRYTWAGA